MRPVGLEVGLELGVEDLLEEVLEAPVVGLQDRVLGRHVDRVLALEAVAERGAGEVADRVVEVVHRHRDAAALGEVEDVELDRLAAVVGREGERQLALARGSGCRSARYWSPKAWRPMMIGFVQPGHQPRDVRDHDRLAEDDAAEDVADRPVRRAVHLLQAELLDPRLVGRDRRALDADAVLLDRVRGVDRDLVLGRVAALDPEVEVLRARRRGRAGSAAP